MRLLSLLTDDAKDRRASKTYLAAAQACSQTMQKIDQEELSGAVRFETPVPYKQMKGARK